MSDSTGVGSPAGVGGPTGPPESAGAPAADTRGGHPERTLGAGIPSSGWSNFAHAALPVIFLSFGADPGTLPVSGTRNSAAHLSRTAA